MSSTGRCYDNARMEAQLKDEYETGIGMSVIALLHCRSESAILFKVKKLGLFVRANVKPDWIA